MTVKLQERLAALSVLLILVGLPAAIWYYETVYRPAQWGREAQVVTLTGIARGGIWTTEPVQGQNYWRTAFKRCSDLKIDATRPVVFRVRSADVLHSFSIPALHIKPIDVYPGHEVIVRIEPKDLQDEDQIGFLCWQVCGLDHKQMTGAAMMGGEKVAMVHEGMAGRLVLRH